MSSNREQQENTLPVIVEEAAAPSAPAKPKPKKRVKRYIPLPPRLPHKAVEYSNELREKYAQSPTPSPTPTPSPPKRTDGKHTPHPLKQVHFATTATSSTPTDILHPYLQQLLDKTTESNNLQRENNGTMLRIAVAIEKLAVALTSPATRPRKCEVESYGELPVSQRDDIWRMRGKDEGR